MSLAEAEPWRSRIQRINAFIEPPIPSDTVCAARLSELLSHASQAVPFYSAHLEPREFQLEAALVALKSLPVMNSAGLRRLSRDLVATGADVKGIHIAVSSATLGPSTVHIQSNEHELVFSAALRGRIERRYGVPRWAHVLDLSPRRTDVQGKLVEPVVSIEYAGTERYLWRLQRYSKSSLAASNEYDLFGRRNFSVIYGAPSRIEEYLCWCEAIGRTPQPNVVVSTFEELTRGAANRFKLAFSCPIVNLYGSTETGFIGASTDGPEPIYVETDLNLVEVLDVNGDIPAGPGELGRVVVTSFKSWVMPIIRYDTGDLAVAGTELFDNLGISSLLKLDGRRGVSFISHTNERIGANRLVEHVRNTNLWPFQLIQLKGGEVILTVGSTQDFERAQAVKLELERRVPELFVEAFTLAIDVAEFRRTAGGKHLLALQDLESGGTNGANGANPQLASEALIARS